MATFNELTNVQQAALQTFDAEVRAVVGQFARMLKGISNLKDANDAGIGTLLSGLTGEIPTISGLADVAPMTAADMQAIITKLFSLLANNYIATDRQSYIRIAGMRNT